MTAFLRAGATRPTTFATEIADLAAGGRTSATRRGGVGHDHVARSVPRLGSLPPDSSVRGGADARPLPRGRLTQATLDDVRRVQHTRPDTAPATALRHRPGAAPPRRPPVAHGVGAAETGPVAGEPDGKGTSPAHRPADDGALPGPGPDQAPTRAAQLIAGYASADPEAARPGQTLHAPDSTRGVVRMNHRMKPD